MKIIRIKTSALLLAVFAFVATAQADRYPVAFSASAGGSVSSAGGQYNSGETVMCTATPVAGYRFVKWSGDVDEFHHHAPTLSVTVGTNALSYSASFAPMEEGEVALDYRGMCFPSHYMKNTVLFGYARNIWDMIEFDGKIYYTYGNASNYGPGYSGNSGAVTFGLIDPLTGALSLDYTTGEEQVRSFRIGDNGNLYAPGLDACGQGGTTYLYTRAKGGAWTKRVGGANTHMCDAVEWNGYEFAANRFSTDGTSFPKITSGNGDNAYLSFSANLYYAAESMFRFVPNGASSFWADTQMKQNGKADRYDLYPGFAYHKFDNVVWPCIGFKPYRPIRYGDSVLYGAAVRHNDHQHLPVNTSLFMASENTQAASSSDPELVVRTVQIGALTNMVCYTNTMAVGTTRTRTWDFLVKEQGGRKIVLALIEQQTDRNCTTPTLMFVYASEGDLSEWREIFRFRTPEGTFARSFEYANGKFYFGLGSEADCGKEKLPDWMPVCSSNEKGASIYTGEIYSYAYDLFDAASEAPPPALPTAAFASAAQTVQENAGTVSISVVLSQASSSAVSIPFTLGGTALAGADYQIPASPLTIPAGQTSGTIDIVLAADGLAEPAETISVVLGTPTGATLGATTTHTLTIAASEAALPPALPAAVFLKALGEGEVERATQNGTSWATAYTNAQEALDAALASADRTLYVAAGVYPLRSTTAVGDGTLKIYGGFAGVDGETLEDRDTEANQSIFTGDINGNDCYIHYELSTNAPSPSVTITTTDCPMVKDGRFNRPPAYTGEYDIYATAINNDNGTGASLTGDNWWSGLFTFSNGATFVLDGIYLLGYRNQLFGASGANTSVTINDCRFYANRGAAGVFSVDNLQSFTLSNSHFAYGVAEPTAGLYFSSPGLVTNCLFESIYSTATLRGGIIHLNNGRYPTVIADSTFTRICRHGKSELAHGGPAVCISAETGGTQPLIRGCRFTFCWNLMTASATGCSPIVGTAGGSWYIEDSRFEHNFISCSVKSGYSYFLVGQHATAGRQGGAYFRNTVFADNVIAAHADEGKGNYALGIAGSDSYTGNNYGNASKHVFVNCLFDRNFAEDRTGRSGVAPVLAEGLLASANTFGTVCGAANCTFISATSANPSVALFGSKHYWPVNVVNCLFLSDADIANPFYSPVVPTDTIGLRAYSCTAQNCFTIPRNVLAEGWQTDWVPLVEEKDSFPVVKVLTPGLRETADLAVTDYYVKDKNVQYRFKPYGSDAWQTLHLHSSAVVTTEPDVLVADAVGDSRPKGRVTRGCVQSLTAGGELGKAVILRREPFGGGDLGGAPSAQNAGALDQSVVTAVPIEGAGFQGWYNEAGRLVESNPEIDLSSFADGAILTAKFATKEVTVTFDLGQGGLFVENDASTISYTMREGDVFPKLPEYVESDEWLVEGWAPSFPSFVPSEDLTITAQVLTKASRVFHIVPPGEVPAGSDRSGSSWANATDDIAAAAADAARYRGELWFKEGTYKLSAPISLYSNVAFIGGFNGTETERNQADPSAHVTLLTGDLNGGNYWLPQGSDPGEGNRTLVFNYEERTLNVPQPASDVQIPVWRVKYTSNAKNAFSDSATSSATNALISGMTIACFSGTAINVTFIKSQTLVENCRFVGNSWDVDTGVVGVKGSLQMRHCDFRYNHGGVGINNADDDRLSVVDDCTFYCNEICRSRVFRYWSQKTPLTSSNCRFENNVYSSSGANSSIEFTTESSRTCTISNWVVRNTRTCPLPKLGNSYANADSANGHIALNGNFTFVRCRFEDNLLDYSTKSLGLSCQSAVFYHSGWNLLCQDCFFAHNTVKSQKAYTERTVVTSVAALNGGAMTFINCTLLDNFADAMESTIAAAATVGDRNERSESGLAFVHCTLANNTAKGGIAAADLLIHPDSENRKTTRHGIGILNSILHNSKDPSYKPLQLLASTPPTILYSALSNININDFNTELDGTLWKDVTDNTSGIAAKTSVSPDGVKALGIKSTSPLTHGTGTIVISGNRPYLWNAENAEGVDHKTYISLVEPTLTKKPDQVGLPSTDKSQPAPLPDAFGATRTIGKLAAGALNAASGFMIQVR